MQSTGQLALAQTCIDRQGAHVLTDGVLPVSMGGAVDLKHMPAGAGCRCS